MCSNIVSLREIFLVQVPLYIQWCNTDLLQSKGIQASVLSAFFLFVNSFFLSLIPISSVLFSPSFIFHVFGLFQL